VREGDAKGKHVLEAVTRPTAWVLTHEAFSRAAFAEGAVRAAEWLATRPGFTTSGTCIRSYSASSLTAAAIARHRPALNQ